MASSSHGLFVAGMSSLFYKVWRWWCSCRYLLYYVQSTKEHKAGREAKQIQTKQACFASFSGFARKRKANAEQGDREKNSSPAKPQEEFSPTDSPPNRQTECLSGTTECTSAHQEATTPSFCDIPAQLHYIPAHGRVAVPWMLPILLEKLPSVE